MATKREDGQDFPAQAFAYVPDAETPSTWKLRLWDSLEQRETPAQVGRAVAALGLGFRGNRVEIPADDLDKVKSRVLRAWLATHPDETRADAPSVIKAIDACPIATKDIAVNLKNRQKAINVAHYGPLNPDQPNVPYWQGIASRWNVTIAEAKKQRCGNCAAFVRTKQMLDCIDQGLGNETGNDAWSVIDAGELGYCEAFDFKCASSRVCDSWIVGGPITGDNNATDAQTSDNNTQSDHLSQPDSGSDSGRSVVQRTVQEIDGQFCVLSETGRSFGCYKQRDQADQRLAQVENFRATKLVQASLNDLVSWHNKCHEALTVSQALKSVHDLLEDEMEDRGHARPYSITSDEKIALLLDKSAGIVAKANEQRYTLGPWYVPGVEDAHGEFTDEETLQKALWDWVRSGDRTIYLQHSDKPAGEMVEIMTVPFAVEADLTVPNQGVTKYQFPANTPFMGVVWEEWSWQLVKEGKLRGYSIGGTARRMSADLPATALI
jgi:hypothetical protein